MRSSERTERINLLRKQAELLKTISTSTKKPEDLQNYYLVLKEIDKLQRIEDGFQDIMVFAKNYFRDVEEPFNLLHADTPSPPFHYELARELRELALCKTSSKLAICAPRSHAKSTIASNIFPLWVVAYQEDVKQPYWMILNATQSGAAGLLDTIKQCIESNPKFIEDFGELKGDKVWNQTTIVTANDVCIESHGTGDRIRGSRWGQARPQVILDDAESDETVATPSQIAKTFDYFMKVVEPLGDPMKKKLIFIGTLLHYDCVLSKVINEFADWKAIKYRAIEQYPQNMHLWQEWERIYFDRSEGNDPAESSRIARKKAMDFYADHLQEMHLGSKVLWPERMDLLALMEKRAQDRNSFNSEFQNDPIDEGNRIFHQIHFYRPEELDPDNLEYFMAIDPSMGQTKRSDPTAIITVARNNRSGIVYVIDILIRKLHPDQIIQEVINRSKNYFYSAISCETVAFQQFLRDELQKRSLQAGLYLPLKEFKSTVKKEVRINAMEPLVTNGLIRFLPNQRDLLEQFERWPKILHDDGLDVTAQVLELAKKKSNGFVYTKI
jgi:predicted phage terminase large subunit-like protein